MNSKKLKEKYYNDYKEFFVKHNIVISMPLLINRARDIRSYKWVSIKQKIPLRIYGWARVTNSGKIELKEITKQNIYTNEEEDHISKKDIIDYAPYMQDLEDYLNEKHKDIIKEYGWIEINIFSEVSRGIWMWYDSVFSMLIGSIILRLKKQLTPKHIEKIQKSKISEVLNKDKIFMETFMEAITINRKILWYGFFWDKTSSFFPWQYPVITNATLLEKNWETYVYHYYWFKLNELFDDLPERPYTSIDFWLIFSWQPTFMEQILWTYTNNTWWFDDIREELKKNIEKKFMPTNTKKNPDFFWLLNDSEKWYQAYWSVMWILSLKILHFIHKAYQRSYDEFQMKNLFKSLRRNNYYQYISRPYAKRYDWFRTSLIEHFNWDTSWLSIFPNDTWTIWWCFVFTTPLQVYRRHIQKSIKKSKYEARKLVYSSWEDWIEWDWLLIEQDIENNIFSEFIEPNNYILKNIDWSNELWNHEDLIKKTKDWLLLDTIDNKIYLNWKKLTSKDLPSQTTTIETLWFLIHNIWKEISNKELPNSSYSKNKNEMLGKIILPTIKLLENKLKRKIPLICKWSIYDFYIKLEKTDIPIYIIQSI